MALESEFGKYDFSFKGNRKYENYVLEFDGSLFIVPDKRAIVLNEKINSEIINKMIRFENTFNQFVFYYIFKNYDNLESYEQESIEQMIQIGFIDETGNISFKSSKKIPKLK